LAFKIKMKEYFPYIDSSLVKVLTVLKAHSVLKALVWLAICLNLNFVSLTMAYLFHRSVGSGCAIARLDSMPLSWVCLASLEFSSALAFSWTLASSHARKNRLYFILLFIIISYYYIWKKTKKKELVRKGISLWVKKKE
jgi:hypothetical protein